MNYVSQRQPLQNGLLPLAAVAGLAALLRFAGVWRRARKPFRPHNSRTSNRRGRAQHEIRSSSLALDKVELDADSGKTIEAYALLSTNSSKNIPAMRMFEPPLKRTISTNIRVEQFPRDGNILSELCAPDELCDPNNNDISDAERTFGNNGDIGQEFGMRKAITAVSYAASQGIEQISEPRRSGQCPEPERQARI